MAEQFTNRTKRLNYSAEEINELLSQIGSNSEQLSTLQRVVNNLKDSVHPNDFKFLKEAIDEIRADYIRGDEVDTKLSELRSAITSAQNRWITIEHLDATLQDAIRKAQDAVTMNVIGDLPAGSNVMAEIRKINAAGGGYDDSAITAQMNAIEAQIATINEKIGDIGGSEGSSTSVKEEIDKIYELIGDVPEDSTVMDAVVTKPEQDTDNNFYASDDEIFSMFN